jgi:hypothetical protein
MGISPAGFRLFEREWCHLQAMLGHDPQHMESTVFMAAIDNIFLTKMSPLLN